jgi:hypothetical protein
MTNLQLNQSVRAVEERRDPNRYVNIYMFASLLCFAPIAWTSDRQYPFCLNLVHETGHLELTSEAEMSAHSANNDCQFSLLQRPADSNLKSQSNDISTI